MRREMVLMEGEFPQEVTTAFNGIERSGNPWGFSPDDRTAWAALRPRYATRRRNCVKQ